MTQDIARRTLGISLLGAVLIVVLGCGHSPLAPLPVLTGNTAPTPAPIPIRYNLSGIVTNENGSPIANAHLILYYEGPFKTAKTSTDARGHYSIAFETQYNAGVTGAIIECEGSEYERYVQVVPFGTADIVQNLCLRRIQTVQAGQSIVVSIDPDSSLAYDGEDWNHLDWVWEKFHVRVADAGTLTVAARSAVGGMVPSLAVFCLYATDNCLFHWAKAPGGSGTGSVIVEANSLFEIRLAIPSRMAPQRYAVATSLQ